VGTAHATELNPNIVSLNGQKWPTFPKKSPKIQKNLKIRPDFADNFIIVSLLVWPYNDTVALLKVS
jgi:hypothetical protein